MTSLYKPVAFLITATLLHTATAAPQADIDFDSVDFGSSRTAVVAPTQQSEAGQPLTHPTAVRSVATALTLVKQSYTDSATGQAIASPLLVFTDTGDTLGSMELRFAPEDEAASGHIAITWDMLVDSNSDGTFNISLRNAANELLAVYQIFSESGAITMVQYKEPGVFAGTTGVADPMAFTTGKVHQVRIMLDLDDSTISMALDGKALRVKSLPSGSSFASVNFASSSKGAITAAIDNIRVGSDEQPDNE